MSGTTAANLQQMGDFYLSPYRMTAPMRINTRNESLSFVKREIAERDIVWLDGLPVTKPERTLVDLCLDCEDPSLIIDAYNANPTSMMTTISKLRTGCKQNALRNSRSRSRP